MAKPGFTLDKRVLIASLPFIGYSIAYNYEKGYLTYFHIPTFFVELSLETVILSTSTVILSLFLLYPFLMILYPLFIKPLKLTDPFHRALFLIIVMFLFFVPFIFIFSTASFIDKLFVSLIILILLIFYELVLPLLFFPSEKIFRQKLLKAEERDRTTGNLEDVIRSRPKLYPYWLLLIFALLFSQWASMAGAREAKKQTIFLTQQSNSAGETYILVRSYQNRGLVVKIDPEKKLILKDFKVLHYSGEEDVYHLKEIGPLDNGVSKKGLTERFFNFLNRKIQGIAERLFSA